MKKQMEQDAGIKYEEIMADAAEVRKNWAGLASFMSTHGR